MNDIENKKHFIANKIGEINNTDKIVNYIEVNKINYSSNTNGLFINISLLNDKIIGELYDLINILLISEDDNIPNNKIIKQKIIKKDSKKEYKKIKLDPYQVDILKLI